MKERQKKSWSIGITTVASAQLGAENQRADCWIAFRLKSRGGTDHAEQPTWEEKVLYSLSPGDPEN